MPKRKTTVPVLFSKIPYELRNVRESYGRGRKAIGNNYRRLILRVEKHPLRYFFALLGLLFSMIVLGNFLRKPASSPRKPEESRQVETYRIGESPRITVNAAVEKSGVVQVNALNGGIVSRIYVSEGQKVNSGQWLLSLATNYQKGNALTLSRQIAEKQNEMVEGTYNITRDLIGKQRNLANEQNANFNNLKDIASKSVDDTRNLVNLNNDIINTLNSNIDFYRSSGADPSLILAAKQLKSQFSSANLQLNSALRASEFQTDSDKSPAKLADLAKGIALKQLDLQEKTLDLNREISSLQLNLARVNESLSYPASPFAGTIQKIFVRSGQTIHPGMPLALLGGNTGKLTASVTVPKNIIDNLSKLEKTEFEIGTKVISAMPSFISSEAVSGNLYQITYLLPDEAYGSVSDKSNITARLPLGYPDTGSTLPFIPLEAVYQTPDESFLFIVRDGKAMDRKVELGSVFGRFVAVNNGLTKGDTVILDRSVLSGDSVSPL